MIARSATSSAAVCPCMKCRGSWPSIESMSVSGAGVRVEATSYWQAGAYVGAHGCSVLSLADDLGNADIGVLLDEPLIEGAAGFEPVLTSDQWASLLQQRRAAGRPLHLAEVN